MPGRRRCRPLECRRIPRIVVRHFLSAPDAHEEVDDERQLEERHCPRGHADHDVPFQQLGKVGGDELQIRINEQTFRWRVAEIHDEWWNAIRRAVEQDERIPSL